MGVKSRENEKACEKSRKVQSFPRLLVKKWSDETRRYETVVLTGTGSIRAVTPPELNYSSTDVGALTKI